MQNRAIHVHMADHELLLRDLHVGESAGTFAERARRPSCLVELGQPGTATSRNHE